MKHAFGLGLLALSVALAIAGPKAAVADPGDTSFGADDYRNPARKAADEELLKRQRQQIEQQRQQQSPQNYPPPQFQRPPPLPPQYQPPPQFRAQPRYEPQPQFFPPQYQPPPQYYEPPAQYYEPPPVYSAPRPDYYAPAPLRTSRHVRANACNTEAGSCRLPGPMYVDKRCSCYFADYGRVRGMSVRFGRR